MSDALREPLVPADCDLRGLPWMPIDTVRLLDSDLFALATGDEFKAAVALWCKAWQQLPAASLPDDDRVLAHLSGAGARWRKVREQALRGFVKCADGRLYHLVIAEKAVEAWAYRRAQRERAAKRWHPAADARAHATAHATASPTAMQGTGTGTGQELKTSTPLSGEAPDGAHPEDENLKARARAEAREAGKRAIEYLNLKAGTKYRATKADLKFAVDRILLDGATEADLKAVVDLKVAHAHAGEFDSKYLRPETLWSATKFGSYIGQVGAQRPARAARRVARIHVENVRGERSLFGEVPAADQFDYESTAREFVRKANGYMVSKKIKTVIVEFAGEQRPFSEEELRAH